MLGNKAGILLQRHAPGKKRNSFNVKADGVFGRDTLIGDANGDSAVDAADYIALKWAFGSSVSLTNAPIDFDCSGTVGHGDLLALTGSVGQSINMAFSAPELPVGAAPIAPSTTGIVPPTTPEPAAAATEPERLPVPVPVAAVVAETELLPMLVPVTEPELLSAPTSTANAPEPDGLAIAASVFGNRLTAGGPVLLLEATQSASLQPPSHAAVSLEPLMIFPSPLLRRVCAGQAATDVLQLAAPWWSSNSARHEAPDEPWTVLDVDIAGKPRKGRFGPIVLDALAVPLA